MLTQEYVEYARAAWECFFSGGELDASVVRPEIAASWQRCRRLGIDQRAPKPPVKLDAAQLAAVREENKLLVETALPFMHFLKNAVKGSGFILVLTDRNGIVLEVFGDDRILEMARDNNYVAGCSRAEAEVGTNAISLALSERKAVQLTGPEHYNVRHHHWTCASAPVLSPDDELLGTVTLSGETINAHRHTLGMVISAAEAILERLRERHAQRRHSQVDALLSSVLTSISEAIVAIDGTGTVTHINSSAARMLAARPEHVVGKGIIKLFPSNPEIVHVLDDRRETGALEVMGGAQQQVYAVTPYIMRKDGTVDGAILAVREQREFLKEVREVSGFNAVFDFNDIIGASTSLVEQIKLARIAAQQSARILIVGETGTGKELFAQAIHNCSPRRDGPFVAINCAAIPRELLESELFGYKGGAFTGSRKGGQLGKLELAEGGTLFLDEISQMPVDLQAKLLRVLQDGMVTRLGDTKPIRVNARIVAATNEDLYEKSCSGGFRQDLYFRLSVVELRLPPLRERHGDIPLLVEHILERIARKCEKGHLTLSEAAMDQLYRAHWPGNIRELENVLEMAAIVCDDGVIAPQHIAYRMKSLPASPQHATLLTMQPMREVEIELIRATMKELNGNIALVSRRLGISRSTIYRRMKESSIVRFVSID